MSALCSAGFFLTDAGTDGPASVIFTFLGAGDEVGRGRQGAGGQDEKEAEKAKLLES
jgi:hypothetical protein